MQSCYSTPVKECQSIAKPSKSHNQTREGDWVCLNCNNLNFSFRKKCNRCKTQTRKQNQDLQNAYTLYFYSQHEGNLYNYENPALYQSANEQHYHPSQTFPQEEPSINIVQNAIQQDNFPRSSQNLQVISISIDSPFKELDSNNLRLEQKFNKKLRTPSSKKKKNSKKRTDILPSVSPLLKKLLAKEDTSNKENLSHLKDPLNVALFYDSIWDNTKESVRKQSSDFDCTAKMCQTHSGKKPLENSRIHKTSDSATKGLEDEGFWFFMRSPQKDEVNDIIQIDQKDEELAQIISKIII